MTLREGYLHDYLVASFLGVAFGLGVSAPAGFVIGNWGPYIGVLVVAGIFGFIPGGLIASYINFRFHQMGENMEMAGLSAGFFAAFVYMVIDLVITLSSAIINAAGAADYFIGWILTVVFAFIFYTIGRYLSGMLERKPFAMPSIFNLSRISRAPPPPPVATTQICPTCGQPMIYVEQYGRWYCSNCKKYS